MKEEGVVVTMNFSQDLDDMFGKLVIAPSVKAQQTWELFKNNPDMFAFAPGYSIDEKGNKTLLEISIIPKALSNEHNSISNA